MGRFAAALLAWCVLAVPCQAESGGVCSAGGAPAAAPAEGDNCGLPVIVGGYRPREKTDGETPLSVLAVFKEGRWRAWEGDDGQRYCLTPEKLPAFVRMGNPAQHYKAVREGLEDVCSFVCAALFFPITEYGPDLKHWGGFSAPMALCSAPKWASTIKPAVDRPPLAPLALRMKLEMQAEEQNVLKCRREHPDFFPVKYDPKDLLPAEMIEAMEFEIAPGEPVLFITLQQRYANVPDTEDVDFSSVWQTLVRKGNLTTLWSKGYIRWDEKRRDGYRVFGSADINGDGVFELLMGGHYYEGIYFDLYEYRNTSLSLSVSRIMRGC